MDGGDDGSWKCLEVEIKFMAGGVAQTRCSRWDGGKLGKKLYDGWRSELVAQGVTWKGVERKVGGRWDEEGRKFGGS